MIGDVTVVVPTIPPRAAMLDKALMSVSVQKLRPADVIVEYDHDHEGPAVVRNRALEKVTTEWVAFLDDDDLMRPQHLRACLLWAQRQGADLVYPWFDVVSTRTTPGWDPLGHFGQEFDADALRQANYIPVTVLVRAQLLRDVGGFRNRAEPPATTCEDWGAWLALLDAGARFSHLPARTWVWVWHTANTSGRNDVW